ncbi:MAG: hypothetical protein J6A05_07495 [Oscillospiraceae bacterium]|nr:hypothetical protein [Oscillospiraceae bacterium]MBQ5318288.1 hypothetical protein [Oscillospiraceae bacterium]
MMNDNVISIKAFAEKNNISQQAVYKKIRRNSDRLNGHISKQNGKMMLDSFAQELLKPVDVNFTLSEKNKKLENLLTDKSVENEKLTVEHRQLGDIISENEVLIETLKSEISEKNTEIENLKNRVIELTDKALEIAELKNMLEELLTVLSENANSSMSKKLGNLFAGKR